MNKVIVVFLLYLVVLNPLTAQEGKYGNHQPFSSYWFVDELLRWTPENDADAKFNISRIPLAERFLNDSVLLSDKKSKHPGIIALMAPHTTSNHPSQGFSSVEHYAFPYWQYIDYFVQWGGSAAEGIIVPPASPWTDTAHKNGVKSIGTVFFPPNVYGGVEEWVYQFLKKNEDGSFPIADKLIEVAETYNFDGWFINQETYNLKEDTGPLMLEFITYYRKKSDLKLVWYDAMIHDSRVIWQDELNSHNELFFQKGETNMSDVFFINFRYNETNLEDSKALANSLGRSEWDLYSGIDVQGKSFKTPVQWNMLYEDGKPKNTSIGLYFSNSTFNVSESKAPEEVYRNEEKFWNGGEPIETRFGEDRTWLGFADYFTPRSVIKKLPFHTNFNYGLGRFYKEEGKLLSDKEWHNLSNQDILPTWQWKIDSTKIRANISFEDSFEGGSSIFLESLEDAELPLYKTRILLEKPLKLEVVSKSKGNLDLEITCQLSNGELLSFVLKHTDSWHRNRFTVPQRKDVRLTCVGIKSVGVGTAYIGEIVIRPNKKEKIPTPMFSVEALPLEKKTELFIHFNEIKEGVSHNIYMLDRQNKKRWLGKTASQDYYIADVPFSDEKITLIAQPVGLGGTKGKPVYKQIRIK
ncbi:MAG: hypothetical protein WBB27_14690 [Maribacter sp.]